VEARGSRGGDGDAVAAVTGGGRRAAAQIDRYYWLRPELANNLTSQPLPLLGSKTIWCCLEISHKGRFCDLLDSPVSTLELDLDS
jgi:hypothetical protein